MMIPSCTFSPLEVIPPSSVQASSGQFRGPAVQLHHGTACSVAAGGSNMAFQVATQLGTAGVLGVGKFLHLGVGGVTLPPIISGKSRKMGVSPTGSIPFNEVIFH